MEFPNIKIFNFLSRIILTINISYISIIMPGGVVQLAIYGSQDIFLTGTPQITFFKIVYRRYTNFAIESIPQDFIGETNFGFNSFCVIDKLGDLMHKVYLEIILPEVNLLKNPSQYTTDFVTARRDYEDIKDYYQRVLSYIRTDTDITRKLALMVRTNNLPMEDIEITMNTSAFIDELIRKRLELKQFILTSDIFNRIEELRHLKLSLIYQINRIDIKILFDAIIARVNDEGINRAPEINNLIKRNLIVNVITKYLYPELQDFYLTAYDVYLEKQAVYDDFLNGTYVERYDFAWVEEMGHSIIDQMEFKIGNQVIDVHTGDFMILLSHIATKKYQQENYKKMIGQVPELIDFNDEIKPQYKLVIPLQFYFCRFSGLALPLVALRYHDVMLNLKMKPLSDLCYVQDTSQLLDIPNIQSKYNINIRSARLFIDYVFLDSDERRRFAQSTHEYLIETIQFNEFPDLIGKEYNAHLTFAHPCKYVIWFFQPNQYRTNPTGRNKCQWNNFGTRTDKSGPTLDNTFIRLNTYERTDPTQAPIFFNYVQPYLYFPHSPRDGEYVYSFGINPLEHQPSGTCNMSRIEDFGINNTFTQEFLDLVNANTISQPGIFMGVYVVSYNILRIMSGMAGLAFQTST